MGARNNLKIKALWKCKIPSMLRIICSERNNRIFEDRLLGEDELFEKASHLAALWVSTNKEVRDFPFIL